MAEGTSRKSFSSDTSRIPSLLARIIERERELNDLLRSSREEARTLVSEARKEAARITGKRREEAREEAAHLVAAGRRKAEEEAVSLLGRSRLHTEEFERDCLQRMPALIDLLYRIVMPEAPGEEKT